MQEFEGKVAIVTGAGRGLGLATATAFASRGARVIVNDLLQADAARAMASLPGHGHSAQAGDVSDEGFVADIVAKVMETYGRIDILVNNAGIFDAVAPTVEKPLSHWRRLVDVNLTGTYMMCHAVAGPMMAARGGVILNLNSIAGVLGLPLRAAYSSSKAGVGMLTRVLGCEWAQYGIRVNAVAPGYVATGSPSSPTASGKVDVARILRRTPMGRRGRPSEVADAMVFLASDQASFITGVTLPVDGGYMAFGAAQDAFTLEEFPE